MPRKIYTPLMEQARSDQVRMLYDAIPLNLISVFVASTLLAVLHWSVIRHEVVVSWLAVVWMISAIRLDGMLRFRRAQVRGGSLERWAHLALVGAVLSGLSWGAGSYFLFAPESIAHQAFLSFVIAGMSAGAVTTLSSRRWAAIGFVGLATLPLVYRFLEVEHEFGSPMAMMTALFAVTMLPVINRFYRNLSDLLSERYERQMAQQRDHIRSRVLEMVAKGAPLDQILQAIVASIEEENPQFRCEMMVRGVGNESAMECLIRPGAPESKQLWLDAGYASWSVPILEVSGDLVGGITVHHDAAYQPTDSERVVIEQAAHVAGIVIERRNSDEALQLASLVYENSSEAMMVTDENDCILTINPAFTDMTGYTLDEVYGRNAGLLNPGLMDTPEIGRSATGPWVGEAHRRRKSGEEFTVWMTVNTIYGSGGCVHRRVTLFSDITDKKEAEALIWHQANFDHLTRLPNRRLFMDRLDQGIRFAHREGNQLAMLFIDLDHFKEVNDTLGHQVGDLLLVEASRRIIGCVRDSDTVGRLGGDEFVVLLGELRDANSIDRVSQCILDTLSAPYQLNDEQVYLSGSVGITIYPNDAGSAEELLKNADQAMFAAKQAGRNRCNFFTRSLQDAAQQRIHLVRDIHRALDEAQFTVHFQPVVELATGRVCKAEALLRWAHPHRGNVSPAIFIPIAEDTGAIHEIGTLVFREVVARVKEWRQRFDPQFQVSVNKSPVQFHASGEEGHDWVTYLQRQGLSGDSIVIEITEGVLLKSSAQIDAQLLRYRDAGIQVAIDDFGTGYSSLDYLKRFDIDYLKIDRSFISNLESDSSNQILSEAMVVMAHKLGFRVIAEGVETDTQRELLLRMGCDYAQGHVYSAAVPADEFEVLLLRQQDGQQLSGRR